MTAEQEEAPEARADFCEYCSHSVGDPFYPLRAPSAEGVMQTNLVVKIKLLECFLADLCGRSLLGQKDFRVPVAGCLLQGMALEAILEPHCYLRAQSSGLLGGSHNFSTFLKLFYLVIFQFITIQC